MTERLSPFDPGGVPAPGETIEDLLEEKGWTQAELATRIGYTKKHVNELVAGRAAVTPETALRLESTLGGAAALWLRREAQYREALLRRDVEVDLTSQADWLAELPIAEMVRRRWIRKLPAVGAQVAECLRFFGVASVDAWRQAYERPLCAFRDSANARKQQGAVVAWLRQGEIEASRIVCKSYDSSRFRGALTELRALTREADPSVFLPHVISLCASTGVAVAFVPGLKGCPVYGATRWLTPDRALLQLSFRYKTDDQFWFTLFHEAGHLLLHGKRLLFVEGTDAVSQRHEDEANRFAADTLIPQTYVDQMRGLSATNAAVRAFADQIGIAPGVVVGRLQREGRLPWSTLNELKVRYALGEVVSVASSS
jgi:addiction module HigA family antidote